MTIKDAIQEIVDELRNVRDLRRVPDAPPESNDQFPFCVVYPSSGEIQKNSAGWSTDLHNVTVELHVSRKDLPRDFVALVDVFDRIPNQLDVGLEAGRFSTIKTWTTISYTFGPLDWGGLDTLGVTFVMNNVKLHSTVST